MNKQEFLNGLRYRLTWLPVDELEDRLVFYSELIDDRMEEGMTEEEAVAAIGTIDEVVNQIMGEIPLTRLMKEKVAPKKKISPAGIILLILGAPLWIPLLIAFFSICLSFFAVLWSVVIGMYAGLFGMGCGIVAGVPTALILVIKGRLAAGVLLFGMCLIVFGVACFWFVLCSLLTKGICRLTKGILHGIKRMLIGKERTEYVYS